MKYEDYKTFRTAIGGKLMEVEIGKVCELANGQAWIRYGDTVVNVTACASKEPREDIDFFPLSCDYEEKMYAAGKIPGGFIKREGRPSERAVLCSGAYGQTIKTTFSKGFCDVRVVATVMCVDNDAPSEIAAMIGFFNCSCQFPIFRGRTYRFTGYCGNDRRTVCNQPFEKESSTGKESGSCIRRNYRSQGCHHDGRNKCR